MWSASVMLQANPGVLDDRLTRGGPLAMLPPQWKVFGSLSSDSRRPVIVTGSLFYLRSAAGGQDVNPTLTVEMRPSAAVRVTLGPSFETLHSTNQYVRAVPDPLATATYGTRYVFADLHQATLSMETRVDWTFTTDLSLQVYAQPFISAGRYTRFKELLAPRTRSFGVYGVDRGTITADSSGRYTVDPDGGGPAPMFGIGNPDFNIRSLRGDAVLRWQYRPGSALFFVWQQQRSGFLPSGNFEPGRDAGAIFRTVPTNVFAVKATFWFAR